MPQVRVLGRGARITGGIFCLLFALHTWIWVLRDVLELGFGDTWDVWTGALGPGAGAGALADIPATTTVDAGLGLLQLAAAFAAFTGAWAAGGLMAVTTLLTFSYRLPVIWHAGLHSESSPYYALRGFFNDPSVDAAWVSCALTVFLCAPLAIVLMAGVRPWTGRPAQAAQPGHPAQPYEPPLPGESPQRPTRAHAVVAAVLLGVLVLFNAGWNIQTIYTSGGGTWLRLFTGEGTVSTLLDVSPAWEWLTLIVVCGTGAVLAMARTVSARGFSLGVAILLLPQALTFLWGYLDAGTFLELGDVAPVSGLFGRVQLLITLAGTVTLIVLAMRPGVPAQPAPVPFGSAVPFGPPPGQAPVQAQPYVPLQPGPGAAGPAPAGPAYAYPPAQPAGGPPAGPPPSGPPAAPPPPVAPPASPPSENGPGGGTFGPPPVY
ncbi:hypothetical protein [Streptomyces winkii]|uniref:hypothetical protein n=1 Tax=Streptomyces winkii TaxID=3051178 RepID=UPI0028D35651|nr:hypothetical protein [Streptomyces sp. DSM 40971]